MWRQNTSTGTLHSSPSPGSTTRLMADELFEAVRKMMAKGRQSLTIAEVENFRLFMPQDSEWRPAV